MASNYGERRRVTEDERARRRNLALELLKQLLDEDLAVDVDPEKLEKLLSTKFSRLSQLGHSWHNNIFPATVGERDV